MTASLLPNIPMPDALNQIVHADQVFYIVHTPSGIQGAAARTNLPSRDRPLRVGLRRKGPKDIERSITVAAGPISIKSNSCRHSLSMKQLRLRLVRPGRRIRERAPFQPFLRRHLLNVSV